MEFAVESFYVCHLYGGGKHRWSLVARNKSLFHIKLYKCVCSTTVAKYVKHTTLTYTYIIYLANSVQPHWSMALLPLRLMHTLFIIVKEDKEIKCQLNLSYTNLFTFAFAAPFSVADTQLLRPVTLAMQLFYTTHHLLCIFSEFLLHFARHSRSLYISCPGLSIWVWIKKFATTKMDAQKLYHAVWVCTIGGKNKIKIVICRNFNIFFFFL